MQVGYAIFERLLQCLVGNLFDEGREIRLRHVEEPIRLQIRRAECQNVNR